MAIKEIPLTQGFVTIVDEDIYAVLSTVKWYAKYNASGNSYYPACNTFNEHRNRITLRMHTVIIPNIPKGYEIDHINGNTLDNRRINLRVCSLRENRQNRTVSRNKKNKYKGVSWNEKLKKWITRVQKKHIGCFNTEEQAANAYNIEAIKQFGEFARLNVIEELGPAVIVVGDE